SQGRFDEAEKVLRYIAAKNGRDFDKDAEKVFNGESV
ncbi:unnamed protein product, partial [Rotaria sp. Silwood1]